MKREKHPKLFISEIEILSVLTFGSRFMRTKYKRNNKMLTDKSEDGI